MSSRRNELNQILSSCDVLRCGSDKHHPVCGMASVTICLKSTIKRIRDTSLHVTDYEINTDIE